MSEAEPRRSVRATKGQHTKSFDELEQSAPKKRQTKKTKKAQEKDQSEEPEEVIRCVCGATEQDEDSGEAWISCETCYVWQHNVCVGVSSFEDEIPENYWCERCRPQDHKELLAGMAKGEKPWEARRKKFEEEEADKKKRKGGRKPKAKRGSDTKDELAKASSSPEAVSKDKKGKRKTRDEPQDDGKSTKRRASEKGTFANYKKPADLPASISELGTTRMGPAKALKKSISHVLAAIAKDGELEVPEDSSQDAMAEGYALEIERAVFDTHPLSKSQKEYGQQIKSLTFNLKNNPELIHGLLEAVHSPATLAIMTSEQLASSEMRKQTAEMRAKAEKQSILYTQETGPRVRRTHKGEEVVEDLSTDSPQPTASRKPQHPPLVKRESTETKARSPSQPEVQHSPTQSNFDIGKVFSTVKSPTVPQNRRPSAPAINTNGPGFDPDVDRMLQDEPDSPPYSPTEESLDPDVVWKGSLAMSSIADFPAVGKHVGGADFASFGPWSRLIPKRMTVAGRIQQQSAIEYLCSLRYSNLTDIVVVSIAPASPDAQADYNKLAHYFLDKNRYGVIGDKVAGNVRDTYLVPVAPGDNGHPEFMLNLVDNYIPKSRTEPLLLAVFVYRNEPEQLKPAPVPISKPANPGQMTESEKYHAQQAGQVTAREVLGPLISVPTVQFLLPQAFQMSRREWEVIRSIYDKEPKARDDLQFLGALLEKEGTTGEAK